MSELYPEARKIKLACDCLGYGPQRRTSGVLRTDLIDVPLEDTLRSMSEPSTILVVSLFGVARARVPPRRILVDDVNSNKATRRRRTSALRVDLPNGQP